MLFFFFFQAEDGIRDYKVTGVQTCALPICQLRKDRELRWAVGKRVRCWLAGGEEHQGRLVDVDDAVLTLDRNGARVELPRARVTKARLDVDVPWPRRPSGL